MFTLCRSFLLQNTRKFARYVVSSSTKGKKVSRFLHMNISVSGLPGWNEKMISLKVSDLNISVQVMPCSLRREFDLIQINPMRKSSLFTPPLWARCFDDTMMLRVMFGPNSIVDEASFYSFHSRLIRFHSRAYFLSNVITIAAHAYYDFLFVHAFMFFHFGNSCLGSLSANFSSTIYCRDYP